MDIADWLDAITQKCHLVVSPDQVVRIAPDLCIDAPALWDVGDDETPKDERYRYPVACIAALSQPVADVVAAALGAALDERDKESFAQHSTADWAADPLTATLARLLLEAALVSREATGLPLLALARISTGLLGAAPLPGSARGSGAAAIERSLPRLQEQDALRQGEILSQVGWSLSARISAAWGLAAQASPGLRPTRFYQAMLRSKLSLTLRADGSIPPVALLLGALGVPGDPALLSRLTQLCEAGLRALEARVGEGKGSPADRQFAASILARSAVPRSDERRSQLLAHDPEVASAYLLRLADFHSAKDLTKLGVDKAQAKQLLKPELAQALVTTQHELLGALQLWDLLGGVITLVERSEDIRSPSWQKAMASRLLVPRGDLGQTKAFVLAARLGDVQGKGFQEARTSDDALVPLVLEARFAQLRAQLGSQGGAVYNVGTHLLCLLPSATSAVSAAKLILEVATPPYGLEFGALRESASIPRGPAVGVGLAYGNVHGGFDGRTQSLRGPAIEQALGLTGIDAPHGALGDPLGVRSVALGAAGLLSKGIVSNPAFIEQLMDESGRQGRRFQLPDSGQPVGGVRKAFVAYPVLGVREGSDRSVTMLLRLDGEDKDSPVEIIAMTVDAFQDFHGHEQGLAPDSCRALGAGGSSAYAPPTPAPPVTQPPSFPEAVATPATPAMASDPFSSDLGSVEPQGGSDFDYELDDGDEYEFEIDAEPFSPPPAIADPQEEDAFSLDDLDVDDFEEGVLVLEEAPPALAEEHPLDSLDSDAFELGDDATDSSPFSFQSDDAFSSGSSSNAPLADDDAFSFDDLGDDEDDPFGSATASNPAAISLSGESSLDAWDTPAPGDPPEDPSGAGEQADDDAPLGYLPPADITAEPREADQDEPIPLGYLPPAPDEAAGEAAELHEVRLPTRPARAANPTLMPEEPAPSRAVPGIPDIPSMPSSLLALIGEDEPTAPAEEAGATSSFQFIAAPVPEPEPEPEPEPQLDVQEPEGDDPWGPDDEEPEPTEPDPSEEPLGAFELEDDDEPQATPEHAYADEHEPAAPLEIPPADQEELEPYASDDGTLDEAPFDDDDAFEALFSDDDDGEDFSLDLADLERAAESAPAEVSEPEPEPDAPAAPEPSAPPEPDDDPFAMDDDPFESAFESDGPVEPEPEEEPPAPEPDEEKPSVEVAAPASPGRGADGARKVKAGRKSRTLPDFSFMFTGYQIYITEKNSVLFGHRHGSHLLDVHEYPCGDDVPEAYARFLKDKIAERFVPRSDLSRPTPKHLEGSKLDVSLLQQAFTNLNEDGT